ncbi:SGNH/GDSL hydrolase family protein [Asticcacaulis sp.]|uniref:SGNH/GDSL hydrolase family protein n=1 Tax=Asticcacaulis sp. TaxID=1872648 RepID=UPI00391C2294
MSLSPTKRKVAVIGNSNSVMRSSYVRFLNECTDFEVTNLSLGACPNSYLIYAFTVLKEYENFDYVFIESAVTDAEWSRLGLYSLDAVSRNLELFVNLFRSEFRSRLVFLILPTEKEIFDSSYSPEEIYLSLAESFNVGYINFYETYRSLRQLSAIVEFKFFEDWLHLSPPLHRLLANTIYRYITSGQHTLSVNEHFNAPPVLSLTPPKTAGFKENIRSTSLLSNAFYVLEVGDSFEFEFNDVMTLISLNVNRVETSCVLQVDVDGSTYFKDLRLLSENAPLILHHIPFISDIKGKHFQFTVLDKLPLDVSIEPSSHLNRDTVAGNAELASMLFVGQFNRGGAVNLTVSEKARMTRIPKDGVPLFDTVSPTRGELLQLVQSAYDYALTSASQSRAQLEKSGRWLKKVLSEAVPLDNFPVYFELSKFFLDLDEFEISRELLEGVDIAFPNNPKVSWLRKEWESKHARYHGVQDGERHVWMRAGIE